MIAVGPYLAGVRSQNEKSLWDEGQKILLADGRYERNLTLARLGILPFFVLASFAVFFWARLNASSLTGLFAVVLFTTLPSILGHSGLATMDMGAAATMALALLALDLWLRDPRNPRSALLGIAVATAVLAKFSALGFLVVCGGLTILFHAFIFRRRHLASNSTLSSFKWIRAAALAIVFTCFTIWAGYRFSVDRLDPGDRPHAILDRIFSDQGRYHDIAYGVAESIPVPAPDFAEGVFGFLKRNDRGHVVNFLGAIRQNGWWYYFPVALAVKTPLPFLALSALGLIFIAGNSREPRKKLGLWIPALCLIGILGLSTQSHVNNGTRHVLAVYPLLALLAGYGAERLFSLKDGFRRIGIGLGAVLLLWHLVSSFAAHPDHLAYFNELAGNQPENILSDSDLDWGQDLKRLAETVRDRGINHLSVRYNGSAPVDHPYFGLSSAQRLEPYQRATGWVAISVIYLKTGTLKPPYDQFSWLARYTPVEKIGKSILLYYIPD